MVKIPLYIQLPIISSSLSWVSQAMAYVQSLHGGKVFDGLLPYVTVFARVSPKQKVGGCVE